MTVDIPKKSALRALEAPAPGKPIAEFLTLKQVAQRLQVCTKTVRRIIRDKNIPTLRVGSQIRIPADHIALFTSKDW